MNLKESVSKYTFSGILEVLFYVVLIARPLLFLITLINPDGSLTLDSGDYISLSGALRYSGQYSTNVNEVDLLRPPGYSVLLAVFRDRSGISHELVVLSQIVLISVACLLVRRTLQKVGDDSSANFAAWMIALSPNIALWSMTIMSESLFTFLILMSALLLFGYLNRNNSVLLFGAGFVLGVSALTRPIGLAVAGLWFLALVVFFIQSSDPREHPRRAFWFLGGFLLAAAPWMVRNLIVHGKFAISDVGASTLESFNFAIVVSEATGVSRNEATRVLGQVGGTWDQFVWVMKNHPFQLVMSQINGWARVLGGSELSRWATVLGIENWNGFGIFRNLRSLDLLEAIRAFKHMISEKMALLLFGIMLAGAAHTLFLLYFAVLGFVRRRVAPEGASRVIWICLIAIFALIVVTGAAGQARFRVPAEPFLAILAGFGWAARHDKLDGRRSNEA